MVVTMKHLLVISLVSVCFHLGAQSFSHTLSSDSILIGNWVELTYTLENLEGKFEAPTFTNLEIISGPNTSSSIQIINGDQSSTIRYSYLLKPTELGQLIIPPAYVVTDESSIEVAPLEIEVYPNPENIITPPESSKSNSIFGFENFSPFGNSPAVPATPTPPSKPKRKYKKI